MADGDECAGTQMHPQIDTDLFRETLGYFPTGVVVITAIDDTGHPVGMVVGSFTSVSLDPPLVAYLPTRSSGSYAKLRTSSTFCVNVLSADQQDLCGLFASRTVNKFDGLDWTTAPHGSPILPGTIGWIECEVAQELDGGDHHIVVGRVLDLAVQRATLPLLFFQGGYGRFALPSPVMSSDPELIQGAQMAEHLRGPLEALAVEIGADCSVMARVSDEVVFVTATNRGGDEPGSLAVGHRIPLIPPLGAPFLTHAPDEEVEQWLARAKASDEDIAMTRANLEAVRARGYSISLEPASMTDRLALMSDYSGGDVLPMHERRIKQMIAESANLYEPSLDAESTHDLHSVIVPVPTDEGRTRLAVRISGLPAGASADQVQTWIDALTQVARDGGDRLRERAESVVPERL